jgi:putative transposase
MEELKTVIRKSVSKGMKVDIAAKIAGMSKSSYYYKPRGGKPGRKPTTHCAKDDGTVVPDQQVVEHINDHLGKEFMENGYIKTTFDLKDAGFIIGKTKTYRLMRENKLLLPKRKKAKRAFVKFTQPLPFEPFEKLEMDIKFIYIRGERKNALLLTIIDTFTRIAMDWMLQYSIRNSSVMQLFSRVIENWLQDYKPPFDSQTTVTIRSDNDARFVANDLKIFMNQNFLDHEFIMPATPTQNAHIESFHSVVEQLVCQKFEFEDIYHARETFLRFYHTYNNHRTISSLNYLPPMIFLQQWQVGNMGMSLRKANGTIKQKFFFRGQRPKWRSVPSEDIYRLGQCKNTIENNNFAKPH